MTIHPHWRFNDVLTVEQAAALIVGVDPKYVQTSSNGAILHYAKQALQKWLRENAAAFGLTREDGNPNETGIQEAAKVANWEPGGGAPKTPGE